MVSPSLPGTEKNGICLISIHFKTKNWLTRLLKAPWNFGVLNWTVAEVLRVPQSSIILWEHFPTIGHSTFTEHALGIQTLLQTLFVQKGAKQLGNSGVECVLISSHLPPELSSWQVWLSPGVLRSKCGSVLITLYRIQHAIFKSLLHRTEEWAALQLINFLKVHI